MKKALWERGWAAFEARAMREKVLLLGALAALTLMAADALLTGPAWQARVQAKQQAQQAQTALDTLRAQIDSAAQVRDASRLQQAQERSALRQQLDGLRAQLEQPGKAGPQLDGNATLTLLEILVARQQGRVLLIGLTSLPDLQLPPRVEAAVEAASANAGPRLYRHGLELVLAGDYRSLQAYLLALASEPRLQIDGWELTVREHPQLELRLRLQAPSGQRDWLTL